MARANNSYQQHEPLRSPPEWGSHGKRFVAQLEEILDSLFARFNRLTLKDFSPKTRTVIEKSIEDAASAKSTVDQTATEVRIAFEEFGYETGEQNGVTTINKNGVTVEHSLIGGSTTLSATGMRMTDADGNIIGGMFAAEDGKVYSAVQKLMNPAQDSLTISVGAAASTEDSNNLVFDVNGVEAGYIHAHAQSGVTGLDIISAGDASVGNGSAGVRVTADGDILFYFYNEQGWPETLSIREIANGITRG